MLIPFFKVESVGNDFVLVERDKVGDADLPQLAIESCRRHFSIGADGLLVIWQEGKDVGLRMFNPDGTEDFCGNGIRCAAMVANHLGWAKEAMAILHGGQRIEAHVEAGKVQSTFRAADFTPSKVPVCSDHELFMTPLQIAGRELKVSALTTGSTHTVILGKKLPSDDEFFTLGPAIENHPLFPERTSVIWATDDEPFILRIRIWERGAGETQGCGTGSGAAAAVYLRTLGKGGIVNVHNPGGLVRVMMDEWNAPITTEAEAEIAYSGALRLA